MRSSDWSSVVCSSDLAMTLTLAAVFAPIGFTEGRTGRLFSEFALTLAGAVLISGFVALTLSPMMCSVLLKEHEKHGRLYNLFESALTGMTNGYRALLGGVLKVRFLVVAVMRSEERRVGKEGVSTCRARGSPYP